MVRRGMMLGEVVSKVVAAFAPMDDVLVLGDAVLDPIKRMSMALERRCLTVSLMMPDAHALSVCIGVGP